MGQGATKHKMGRDRDIRRKRGAGERCDRRVGTGGLGSGRERNR